MTYRLTKDCGLIILATGFNDGMNFGVVNTLTFSYVEALQRHLFVADDKNICRQSSTYRGR